MSEILYYYVSLHNNKSTYKMKKSIITILLFAPLTMMAQNTWEVPTTQNTETVKKKALFEKKPKTTDKKYLEGAVPVVDGKVTFTLDKDFAGKSADEIYNKVYTILDNMTKESSQVQELDDKSRIAVVNKTEHTIAARYKEWIVFKNSALSLDRTVFSYTIVAKATDGHLNLTLSRISYQYEMERTDAEGINVVAEDWITDKEALNKKKTGLVKYAAKFRIKTIDRKDEIFKTIEDALR